MEKNKNSYSPSLDLNQEFDENADNKNQVVLSDESITEITDALHDGKDGSHVELVEDLSPADTADLLQKISEEDRAELLKDKSQDIHPETFSYLDPDLRKVTLQAMPAARVAEIITDLDSDDALDLIETLKKIFNKTSSNNFPQKLVSRLKRD